RRFVPGAPLHLFTFLQQGIHRFLPTPTSILIPFGFPRQRWSDGLKRGVRQILDAPIVLPYRRAAARFNARLTAGALQSNTLTALLYERTLSPPSKHKIIDKCRSDSGTLLAGP